MIDLKEEIRKVISTDRMNINDAQKLAALNWREASLFYPKSIKNEIEVFFLFVAGFIEEVNEGFVDGCEIDTELLIKAQNLYEML